MHAVRGLSIDRFHNREPKIANLDIAMCVTNQVAWLEVAMNHTSGMEKLYPDDDLVEQETHVVPGPVLSMRRVKK